jgi:hypothetical protein
MKIEYLYGIAHDITKDMEFINKYTWLGYHKVIPVRYLDINDTMEYDLPINNYIIENETILLFPNYLNDKMIDINIRPLDSKNLKIFRKANLPYNIGNLSKDFKYGDPLYLVEGIGDLGGLKLIDPHVNVLAIRTNAVPKDMYPVLASITNNITLVLDGDDAAKKQINYIKNQFKTFGVSVNTIGQFGNLKDTGEIVELVMKYQETKDATHLELLNLINIYYKNQINLNK